MKYARRHAAAAALCEALPVPLLDTALQNRVRRNLVRTFAQARGDELSDESIRECADRELVPWDRIVWWPVKKVVSKLVPFWTAWEMLRTYNDTLAFAQSQHEVATLPG